MWSAATRHLDKFTWQFECSRARKNRLSDKNPKAASELLQIATNCANLDQRVIFFCACQYPKRCHRSAVASLVLREAGKHDIPIEIEEWPGGTPNTSVVRTVTDSERSCPVAW